MLPESPLSHRKEQELKELEKSLLDFQGNSIVTQL